jgi:hypothetical protein
MKEHTSMQAFATFFANIFDRGTPEEIQRRQIIREWDRQRARAISQNDLAEIDAIFSRHL